MAGLQYDTNAGLPTDFEPFPEGTYNLEFTDAEELATKNGEGKYVYVKAKVIDGEYKGRLIFSNITTVNKNEAAERIGHQQLNAIAKVLGFAQLDDVKEICYKQFSAAVKILPAKEGYPAKNAIDWAKTVKLLSGVLPQTKSQPVAPAPQEAAPTRPWARKAIL